MAPIIWPLRNVNNGDIPALQAALRPKRMFQPMFMQQRPRSTSRLLAPELPVNRPWNAASSRFGIIDIPTDTHTLTPSVVHQLLPPPATIHKLTGITKDSTGAPLGACTVTVLRTIDNAVVASDVSDANGNYSLQALPGFDQRVDSYKAGSPDVAGGTVNTLRGS